MHISKKSITGKHIGRLVSLILACSLVFSCILVPGISVRADTLDELEQKYDEIEDKMRENQKKMDALEKDKRSQKSTVDALQSEINGLNSQIDILDNKISILEGQVGTLNRSIAELDGQITDIDMQIAKAKQDIADTKQRIDDTYDTLLQRLAVSYMMGNATTLELLIGSKSLAELLTWNQYLKNASDYDNRLIEGLKDDIASLEQLNISLNEDIEELNSKKAEINSQKSELKAKQADVQASADELSGKKLTVQVKHGEAVQMLRELDQQSEEYARIQKQLADEQEKIDAEINAYLAAKGSSQSNPGDIKNDGSLIWPVPYNNCYISAYYGTYPSGGVHKGLDICVSGGSAGKNIIAAQSGKVIQIGYNHWSMGNYIILDHGNGLFTAYYHASKLLVSSVGQTVKQGDVIALIGSTGNTTGPHLHFEVRVNKSGTVVQVNPLNYVSKP